MLTAILITIAAIYFIVNGFRGRHRESGAAEQTRRAGEIPLSKTIEEAIRVGNDIQFSYVDRKGTRTCRTITPYRLTRYYHLRGFGSSLCVEGFCKLRIAQRTFALKRMSNVEVTAPFTNPTDDRRDRT